MKRDVGKYEVIYADPPWQFRVWSAKGNGRSAEKHYRTTGTTTLSEMNVPGLAAADSVLLMWATFPCLADALRLGAAWGFTYKTVAFTWIKQNVKNGGLFCGMG
jgi:N6-adenosine-specific RNA methylase IME4